VSTERCCTLSAASKCIAKHWAPLGSTGPDSGQHSTGPEESPVHAGISSFSRGERARYLEAAKGQREGRRKSSCSSLDDCLPQ